MVWFNAFGRKYNPNNFFHNQENVFIVKQQQSNGNEQDLVVVSFNVLCIPKESTVELKGFEEIK